MFRILDVQISWHHQMPKYKIRNIFYWITWKVNNFILQKKISNNSTKALSKPFSVSKELSTSTIGKWIFETS